MGETRRFLVVSWNGGGNIVPAAALVHRLAGRGHDVSVLGPESIRKRFSVSASDFNSFARATEPGPISEIVFDENLLAWTRFFSGKRLAQDVIAQLESRPVDAVVVDAALPAALAACEKVGVPTAALVHTLYQPYVQGQGAKEWDPVREVVDVTRRFLGLPELDPSAAVLAFLWDRTASVLACVPKSFDYPLTKTPPNLHYVGPLLEQADKAASTSDRPLVLVSFSTTQMSQGAVLQRVLDALGRLDVDVLCTLGDVPIDGLRRPANAEICPWLQHSAVIADASVVVTHGGLSTVMTALAGGVPLLCMPMGRDQPWNADRVVCLGAGRQLSTEADDESIAAAVMDLIENPSFRKAAGLLAKEIADYGNGTEAIDELEALASARGK